MKKINLLLVLCAPFFYFCSRKKIDIRPSVSQQIVGEWQNVYIRVEMPTANNTNLLQILEISEENSKQKLKLKPLHTSFNANRTYQSEYKNYNGEIIYNPSGIWTIIGDTLVMMDTYPTRGKHCKYKIDMEAGQVALRSKEDYDYDGKVDDFYYGLYRKVTDHPAVVVK
ncbi:MAG TPA: hypothetical protein VGF30_15145 [Bacteroidia bacterium]